MGERKGQNKYYPPDFDYRVHKNLNRYHGTHALRERATKIGQGIITIRFEMPFNIWCLGCENHVGMGVRYNAEKKKIGMYHTTPLFEFRMKCHLCDNYYVIRTDPKNFDYELVEGCRRQEKRFDPSEIDNLAPVDRTFNQQLNSNAMFKVEHQQQDLKKSVSAEDQMMKLEFVQDRMRDDFAANQALRRGLKLDKQLHKEAKAGEDAILAKTSLQIHLLPEDPADKRLAKHMLSVTASTSREEQQNVKEDQVVASSIFDKRKKSETSSPPSALKSLRRQLKRSAPSAFPSSHSQMSWVKKPRLQSEILGITLKTHPTASEDSAESATTTESSSENLTTSVSGPLVSYSSSSSDSE
uniref:Coiled-coil domain-containing protein 130 homolog n=1 Tax=Steinernema glaseri TaxID=37863 RepID=A0A1I8AUC4_9BILA